MKREDKTVGTTWCNVIAMETRLGVELQKKPHILMRLFVNWMTGPLSCLERAPQIPSGQSKSICFVEVFEASQASHQSIK